MFNFLLYSKFKSLFSIVCVVQQYWYFAGGVDCGDVGVYCDNKDLDCYKVGVYCDDGMFIVMMGYFLW